MLNKILSAIKQNNAKKIAVQVPEGLKTRVQDFCNEIEKLGVKTMLFADPCFGACDIPDNKAKELGCDLIVHIGHSDFGLKTEIPVVYIDYPVCVELKDFDLPYNKIGLLTTIQHVHELDKFRDFLEKNGKKVFVGGQILGCNLDNTKKIEKNVDCFLFIGSGRFHPLGIVKNTNKPVFQYNTESNSIAEFTDEKEKLEKQKIVKLSKFKDSKKVGLLVSTKKGQMNKDIFEIKGKIESLDKEVWILAMEHISPEKLLGMEFDCLVNTACPRIEDDLVFKHTVIDLKDICL